MAAPKVARRHTGFKTPGEFPAIGLRRLLLFRLGLGILGDILDEIVPGGLVPGAQRHLDRRFQRLGNGLGGGFLEGRNAAVFLDGNAVEGDPVAERL